jgi:hypothetical protein
MERRLKYQPLEQFGLVRRKRFKVCKNFKA